MSNARELADFLRRRRESLPPDAAEAAVPTPRRVPGLRRDEVAARANMSVVYYERLERARGPVPSASMLGGIARALRLSGDERDYLYRLAGQAAPAVREPAGFVDPALQVAMAAVAPGVPAAISDDLMTIVDQNAVNAEIYGDMIGDNIVRRWFTEPAWRDWQEPAEQHTLSSRAYVADLRSAVGARSGDPAAQQFVAELRAASAEFGQLWEEHPVAVLNCTAKRIDHPRVGRLHLDCSVMLSPASRQRLLLLRAVPGTRTEEKLTALQAA